MATIITQTVNVELSTGKVIPTAFVHQNDTSRTIIFKVTSNGMPWDLSDCTIKFAYKSPIVDGQYTVIAGSSMVSGEVESEETSWVYFTPTIDYTGISGVGMLTMIITPTSGTVRPVNIRLVVQKAADGADVVVGASDFPTEMQEYTDTWMDENVSLFNDMRYPVEVGLYDGYWNDGGTSALQSAGGVEVRTDIIPVSDASAVVLEVSVVNDHNNWCCCLFYGNDNEPLERQTEYFNSVSSYKKIFTVPSGAAYGVIAFRTFGEENMTYSVYYVGTPQNVFMKKVDGYTEYNGYITSTNTIAAQDSTRLEKYTSKIPVENVSYMYVGLVEDRSAGSEKTPWCAIAAYDRDGEFIERYPMRLISNSWATFDKRSIPNGVSYIALTYRSYGLYKPVAYLMYDKTKMFDSIDTSVLNDIRYPVDVDLYAGYWNADGTTAKQSTDKLEVRTDIFPVPYASTAVLKVSFGEAHDHWCCCIFYDSENAPLERQTAYFYSVSSFKAAFAVPSGAEYASFAFRTFGDSGMTYEVYYIGNAYNVFLGEIEPTEIDGLINWRNGSIDSPDSTNLEKHTPMYSVENVSDIYFGIVQSKEEGTDPIPWLAVAKYDENGNFIQRTEAVMISGSWARLAKFPVPSDVKYVAFTYRSYGQYKPKVYFKYNQNKVFTANDSSKKNLIRFKPCYDHLFVNRTGNDVTIPHESLYHVRLSKAFGYDVIEANLAKTSDGVFVVNHLSSGKFGGYFHHVDGTTDISNTRLDSVTWDWVVQNVRYNSTIPKYRTRPCRLEEFLGECKQQGMIPFATTKDVDAIAILDGYMGKDNYIAYGASRSDCPNATIYHWVTKTTKAEIVEYCKSIGTPFIYGMSNPNAFTDSELRDIVDTLHSLGYQIGVSYRDTTWHKLEYLGIDYNGSQGRTNRLERGNYCNKNSTYGFDRDFTVLGATETDGVLTFTNNGSITPTMELFVDNPIDYGIVDIEVSFNGTITIPAFGEHTTSTSYTSDGTMPFFVSIPVIHGTLCCPINVTSGTIVYDVKYRASAL